MNNRVNAKNKNYNLKKQSSRYSDNLKLLFITVIWVGFSFLSFFAVKVFAEDIKAQEFVHDPTSQIPASVGTKSQTRISFGNIGIKEIVGDSNKYTMVHDTLGTSIFIMPKVKAGEKINVTIISRGGKVQDLSLRVRDSEGGVILIKEKRREDAHVAGSISHYKASVGIEKFDEAKEMLRSMVLGVRGKYDVTEFAENSTNARCYKCLSSRIRHNLSKKKTPGVLIASLQRGLEVKETHIYKYRLAGIRGVVLEIKNKTKKPISFDDQILSRIFAGTILINSESTVISAKGSIYAFVVMNDLVSDREEV